MASLFDDAAASRSIFELSKRYLDLTSPLPPVQCRRLEIGKAKEELLKVGARNDYSTTKLTVGDNFPYFGEQIKTLEAHLLNEKNITQKGINCITIVACVFLLSVAGIYLAFIQVVAYITQTKESIGGH